ncbi:unnamed protein product [Lampetra planeri]
MLGLNLDDWRRLQMEDISLIKLHHRAGQSEGSREGFASFILRNGLLITWDGSLRQYTIVVPTALRGKAVGLPTSSSYT